MKLQRITTLACTLGFVGLPGWAQTTENPPAKSQGQALVAPKDPFAEPKAVGAEKDSARAEAYYNYTMGHIYEQQYEASSNPDYATKAIEAYKKAYALDPKSPVIGERLAEMYWKAQRTREAENEAKDILKRDSNDVPSRRLLGRIYLRSLGDMNAGSSNAGADNKR